METMDWLWAIGLGALCVMALALTVAPGSLLADRRRRRHGEYCWQEFWAHADHWIAILDERGQLKSCNRPLPTLEGEAPAGTSAANRALPAPWRLALGKAVATCIETGAAAQVESGWDHGQERRTFRHRLIPLPAGDPAEALILVTCETSDQTKAAGQVEHLENALLDAQRREALGLLAAGMAHDVNNLLGPILIGVQLCLDGEWSEREQANCLRRILKSVERAKTLLYELLHCYTQTQHVREPHLLQDTVAEVLGLIEPWAGTRIALKADLDPDAAPIVGDPGHLHQLLLNLCMNGCQAMRDQDGTLTIQLANRRLEQAQRFGQRTLPAGRYVALKVADTGEGLDARTLSRLFDPLCSTRQEAGGSGLGLFMVHKIAEAHRAQIKVSSCRGGGTEVTLLFPAHATPALRPGAGQAQQASAVRVSGRVDE